MTVNLDDLAPDEREYIENYRRASPEDKEFIEKFSRLMAKDPKFVHRLFELVGEMVPAARAEEDRLLQIAIDKLGVAAALMQSLRGSEEFSHERARIEFELRHGFAAVNDIAKTRGLP